MDVLTLYTVQDGKRLVFLMDNHQNLVVLYWRNLSVMSPLLHHSLYHFLLAHHNAQHLKNSMSAKTVTKTYLHIELHVQHV